MKVAELNVNRAEVYNFCFRQVFKTEAKSVPEKVYISKNDNGAMVGFISGHRNFDGLFYIEYAGILPFFQKGPYLRHLEEILKEIGGGFITAVENSNIVTMKILLTIGFIPIGFRTVLGSSYVEFARNSNG